MNTSRAAQGSPKVSDTDVGSRRKPAETPRREVERQRAPEETHADDLEAYNMPCTD